MKIGRLFRKQWFPSEALDVAQIRIQNFRQYTVLKGIFSTTPNASHYLEGQLLVALVAQEARGIGSLAVICTHYQLCIVTTPSV